MKKKHQKRKLYEISRRKSRKSRKNDNEKKTKEENFFCGKKESKG